MKNALILLAGGSGKRLGGKVPKQFLEVGNTNFIDYFLSKLDSNIFDIIIITLSKPNKKRYLKSIRDKFRQHNIYSSLSGHSRQISSKNGLIYLKKFNPKNVLIHDSARPLAENTLIKKIIKKLKNNISCIPYISHNDFIRSKKGTYFRNDEIFNIQTPQGFIFKKIYSAHQDSKLVNAKDDSAILESIGEKLKMVKGDIFNIKITYKNDLEFFKKFKEKEFRNGIGYDIHKIDFKSKRKLTLCGVKITHPPLIGHSDADVGYHAVCDSILGSLSMKDIGHYFNDKNIRWKNANSKIFVIFCKKQLKEKGYKIINIDINFICETPNIRKNANQMKKNLSKLLDIPINIISIKATTNEKISFIGRGEGIAAESIIQIVNV